MNPGKECTEAWRLVEVSVNLGFALPQQFEL